MTEDTPGKKPLESGLVERLAKILDLYKLKGGIDPKVLLSNMASLEFRSYQEGEHIIEEGTEGRDLFVVSKGSATVTRGGAQLARLTAGDMFGEVAFLAGKPALRSATVTAGEGCEIFRCEAKGFEDILSGHPDLAESVKAMSKSRTRKFTE